MFFCKKFVPLQKGRNLLMVTVHTSKNKGSSPNFASNVKQIKVSSLTSMPVKLTYGSLMRNIGFREKIQGKYKLINSLDFD